MRIKKGDKVVVIAGDDKGKTGVVQVVYPKLNRLVVEGVNVHKKHKKPSQATPEGSIQEIYAPIDASNVALIDPKSKKATRIRVDYDKKNNVKVRLAAKSGERI